MTPSMIPLRDSLPPLCATFGRSEREAAATIMVATMTKKDDLWGPVSGREMHAALMADDELKQLAQNPFWRPDFADLAIQGFARYVEFPGNWGVEFTAAGVDRLCQRAGFHLPMREPEPQEPPKDASR